MSLGMAIADGDTIHLCIDSAGSGCVRNGISLGRKILIPSANVRVLVTGGMHDWIEGTNQLTSNPLPIDAPLAAYAKRIKACLDAFQAARGGNEDHGAFARVCGFDEDGPCFWKIDRFKGSNRVDPRSFNCFRFAEPTVVGQQEHAARASKLTKKLLEGDPPLMKKQAIFNAVECQIDNCVAYGPIVEDAITRPLPPAATR